MTGKERRKFFGLIKADLSQRIEALNNRGQRQSRRGFLLLKGACLHGRPKGNKILRVFWKKDVIVGKLQRDNEALAIGETSSIWR